MNHDPGLGATDELNLRVSVATLARVLFKDPQGGEWMLALERKATLRRPESTQSVEVKSQPFGGAIRILDPKMLRSSLGEVRYDGEYSRSVKDFRIFIRASDWERVREFCIEHLSNEGDPILETTPARELAEEFAGALKVSLRPDQYTHRPVATVVEDSPAVTDNVHARRILTARVFRIFEIMVTDSSLAQAMLATSESISDHDLSGLALHDAQNGGRGWANSILAVPLKQISEAYLALPPEERNAPIMFEENRLDETVAAVLEGISVPRYRRL